MGQLPLICISISVLLLVVSVCLTWRAKLGDTLHAQKISQLLKNIRDARDDQKDIIYRNMHDQLNPMLRFVARNLEAHQVALKRNRLTPQALDQDIDMLLMALNDIRSCTHGEMPATLKQGGFIRSLERMLQQQAGSRGILINFTNTTSFATDLPFDHLRQTDLYRISSELIENIIKHASSNTLEIVISATDEKLAIEFVHDGQGMTNEQAENYMQQNKGTGLQSVKVRARFLNAEINYKTRKGFFITELIAPFEWTNQLK